MQGKEERIKMVDYHVHTELSFDSEGVLDEYAAVARQRGITEFCLTEHFEPGYPYDVDISVDWGLYEKNLSHAREAAPEVSIGKGVEIGILPENLAMLELALADKGLDFIIASLHVSRGLDPYYPGFFDGLTIKEIQRVYLEEMTHCLKNYHYYNVVGHIGYMDKYIDMEHCGGREQAAQYADFPEVYDELLRTIITSGRGIEINTSSYASFGFPLPHPTILRRYIELGGEIITTGSDSHRPQTLGNGIRECLEILSDCGGKYVAVFKGMEPTFTRIEDL
ncbi:MAG: histidinol-phosphatase HisJ family protein [Christensenellaceae bacterium]|jgi:histidinol-phosphatase (PHP family)